MVELSLRVAQSGCTYFCFTTFGASFDRLFTLRINVCSSDLLSLSVTFTERVAEPLSRKAVRSAPSFTDISPEEELISKTELSLLASFDSQKGNHLFLDSLSCCMPS